MESIFKLAEEPGVQGDLVDNWKKFVLKFHLFMTATELETHLPA